MSKFKTLNLSTIPEDKQDAVLQAFKDKDVKYFLYQIHPNAGIQFVEDNADNLLSLSEFSKMRMKI